MKLSVTVFIPTYNRAHYLRETIESVLRQSHQPIEVIVLDDASTDATPEVVAAFGSRVTFVRHSKNLGMAANWRAGLERVKTPYFCLLNDDDLLAPDCIEKLLLPMEADPELAVSFCDHWVIDGQGRQLLAATEETSIRHHRKDLDQGRLSSFGDAVVLHRSLHISCSLLRTAMVPPNYIEERAQGFACGWLFYQCYLAGHAAYYLPERLVSYRVHEGNMVSDPEMSGYITSGQIFWCEHLLEDPLPEPLRSKARAQVAQIFASHATGLLGASHYKKARDFYRQSLAIQPSLKAFCGLTLNAMGVVGRNIVRFIRGMRKESTLHHMLPTFAWATML